MRVVIYINVGGELQLPVVININVGSQFSIQPPTIHIFAHQIDAITTSTHDMRPIAST